MKKAIDLKEILSRIDGRGYKAYKGIKGEYSFEHYTLFIDHVQGDPFANPSRVRVRVERKESGFLEDTTENKIRTIGLCDFLTRLFFNRCIKFSRGNRGSGKSGLITIDKPVQEVLERSSMIINNDFVEARFFMGLPAFGRKISCVEALPMFFDELPDIVNASLFAKNLDHKMLYYHIESVEDAEYLRNSLEQLGIVAFVADGSLLPRASGIDPVPMQKEEAFPFKSPESLKVEVSLPNSGKITGMGIPRGVTLIVGGGYHGKSTLLNALELGIYNHIPGDGREFAVAVLGTVKIRAADGRNIEKTDISPFINNLPLKKDTFDFSTKNASGSTSQAASISESIEAGAEVLLLDEDTSATNFMIRDHRMQQLVSKDVEPITPFVDKVKQLYEDMGISTILVMGGSGDYFSVADLVIQMTAYAPHNVTQKASKVAKTFPTGRLGEGGDSFGNIRQRVLLAECFNPFWSNNRMKIAAGRLSEIIFGNTTIDMWDVEQVVDMSQTRAMGYAIYHATKYMDGKRTLKEIIDLVLIDLDRESLDILPPYITGDLAHFRGIELAAAINRMRTLVVKQLPA